jgi:hypothetical protein
LKTALKPNATIPIVWAVLTTTALLLCTTHPRCIWRSFRFAEINAVQAIEGHSLRIISADLDTPDLLLPLPKGTEHAWLSEFILIYEMEARRP